MRAICLRLILMALLLLAAGCATLPEPWPRSPQNALQDVGDSPLARIAGAAAPPDRPGLSGFRLFFDGAPAFNARIALARRATRSLDAQYYLLAGDATGRGFLRELRDAAQRGVRVRLLVDDLHAGPTDRLLSGLAAYPNVQVRVFNPLPTRGNSVGTRLLFSLHEFGRVNHRMHNKLFIADGAIAVLGGRNVADEYFMRNVQSNHLDLDLLATGPVVRELSAVFDRYWNSVRAYAIEQLIAPGPAPEARDRFDADVRDATVRLGERNRDWMGVRSFMWQLRDGVLTLAHAAARVLVDAPGKVARDVASSSDATVAGEVLALLATARQEVLIASPYFIPGQAGMRAVREVGAAGIEGGVTLLTNSFGATDEPLAYSAYARYRLELLQAGVRIHELSPTLTRDSGRVAYFGNTLGRLHTKALTVDRRWLFVGSTNLDPRSASVNTEVGLVIDSPELARQINGVLRNAAAAGAYRLRLGSDARRIEWVEVDWHGNQAVHTAEPHDDPWLRFKVWLFGLFVSEELL